MSESEKLNVLTAVLGRGYKSGEERLFFCPNCSHHKKKLSVNIAKNKFKCWICDYRGNNIRRVVRRHGSVLQLRDWNNLDDSMVPDLDSFESLMATKLLGTKDPETIIDIGLPKEFRTLTTTNLPVTARPAFNFLRSRGVTKEDILRWKIGYCSSGEYEGRVVIPSFGEQGNVNYYVGRSYTNDWRKYLSPATNRNIVFNELYVDWDSDLVIVEGVFDAIVAGNAVPILGSSISERSKLFKEIVRHDTPVYIALDSDAEKKAMILIKQLMEYGVELYKVDLGSYSDVGEMTREEFLKKKETAPLMNEAEFISRTIEMA